MRLKEALTAACSRRRADVLVVRLPPAIDSLDSLRDAPLSLKNSSGTLLRQNSRVLVLICLSLSTLSKQLIFKTLQ